MPKTGIPLFMLLRFFAFCLIFFVLGVKIGIE